MSELRPWGLLGLASIVWVALGAAGLATGDLEAIPVMSEVIGFLLLLTFLVERWGWRWIPKRATGTPVLIGTWQGELRSLYVDPKTKRQALPKRAYLVVSQTLTTVSVRLLTDEAESTFVAGVLTKGEAGLTIAYVYQGVPAIEHRRGGRSPIHFGGAMLKVLDGQNLHLDGEYWAERNSSGSFSFDRHSARRAVSFTDAEGMTFAPRR